MIIPSLLDTDLYKITQQNFVLQMFPDVFVKYRLINRRPSQNIFTDKLKEKLFIEIENMSRLPDLTNEEISFLRDKCPFLPIQYLEFLRTYKFNPEEVFFDNDGNLTIYGPWYRTILWEVPLMAIISELYFNTVDINWSAFELDKLDYTDNGTPIRIIGVDYKGQANRAYIKAATLLYNSVHYSDFGTRRRRSLEVQRMVLRELVKGTFNNMGRCIGTSNVMLAKEFNIQPIGTMAHELFMGIGALVSLCKANKFTLQYWKEVYKGNLGIALTDTFTSEAFFKDFDFELSNIYDGVRQDSGDPFTFAKRAIAHYEQYRIDPKTKTIIFSDNLTTEKAVAINKKFSSKIKCSFGIGTHFSNDFPGSPALNFVIKLAEVNNIPVVKLSDEPGKVCGDPDAVRVAKWTFLNQKLDN
jgi:nicotinate phosphoribosyltransferase